MRPVGRDGWQCVLIAWGDRYPVAEINLLIDSIAAQSPSVARFVLLTDRDRPGLRPDVVCRQHPAWWLQPAFRGGGCQAKLAMFEAGVVPDDLPAVYVDLDTVVLGDLSRLLRLLRGPQTVAILQSALLPFGAVARALYRLTGKRRYARGNSSIVVFHPAHCTHIAATFRAMQATTPGARPMIADERFISWVAQPDMVAIPTHMAVKLPTEYMQPWPWLVHLRASLPWIRRRRAGLIAVTLPGVEVKGAQLLDLPEGAVVTDRKGRRLIWTDRALGPLRARLIAHYARLSGPPTS
jgi:hypothetical protein